METPIPLTREQELFNQTMKLSDELGKEQNEKLKAWGYPCNLIKACSDPYSYKIGLTDGTVLEIHYAEPVSKEWIQVKLQNDDNPDHFELFDDRLVDVRLSEIIWVADQNS